MENKVISEADLKKQVWKYYFVLLAWPLYLFLLPYVNHLLGAWSLLYMVFPGVYLFTWAGYHFHESWHKYVPGVNHTFFYNAFGVMLLTDPQIYGILHGYHHSMVNSYEDHEFHPFGRIKNRILRIIHNNLEILLGIAYLTITAQMVVPVHPKYKKSFKLPNLLLALVAIILFWGGIGFTSALVFRLQAIQVVIPILVSVWLNSFIVHQSQLVEHGNLIAEGNFTTRNGLTRNLSYKGLPEKLFLFFTHGDSQEHVLHHTMVNVFSRPFPGRILLPKKAVIITLKDYIGVLKNMITGKEIIIKQD